MVDCTYLKQQGWLNKVNPSEGIQMTRKLASIQSIAEVKSIPEADKICAYRINGWWVVDQVGKYQVGNLVIYLECDSWVPTELAPFLSKGKEPKEYMGIHGERLRTIRLKKQISQGFLLSLDIHAEIEDANESNIGHDISELLGIVKWEPPMEFSHADAKGTFPSFIPKTDQERIQNCYSDLSALPSETTWEVTEKIEGQSFTAYIKDGVFGVCSRNLELKDSEGNIFWNTARKYDLEIKLKSLGRNLAIQGEQCGPGISGNIYGMKEYSLYVFDIYCLDTNSYLTPKESKKLAFELGLEYAPVLYSDFSLIDQSCSDILEFSNGKSVLGYTDTLREGLVFKANNLDYQLSFKAVSNEYLLKQKN